MSQLPAIFAAVLAGTVIGLAFGIIQQTAALRYALKQKEGQFKGVLSVVPGSFSRIGYLLLGLILVQLICPILFTTTSQWFVSGGLALGYGYVQLRRILQLRKELAS